MNSRVEAARARRPRRARDKLLGHDLSPSSTTVRSSRRAVESPRGGRGVVRAAGCTVEAVSWTHSDRFPPRLWTGGPRGGRFAPFVSRAAGARGMRVCFVPFFVHAQGGICSALRGDLEKLQRETASAGGSPSRSSMGFCLSGGASLNRRAARARNHAGRARCRRP